MRQISESETTFNLFLRLEQGQDFFPGPSPPSPIIVRTVNLIQIAQAFCASQRKDLSIGESPYFDQREDLVLCFKSFCSNFDVKARLESTTEGFASGSVFMQYGPTCDRYSFQSLDEGGVLQRPQWYKIP